MTKRVPASQAVEAEPNVADPTVVAIDPGGTTGWAVLQVHAEALTDPDVPILANVLHYATGQFTGSEMDQAMECVELWRSFSGAALLIEDFILQILSADRQLLSPVRITAYIEAFVNGPRLAAGEPEIRTFRQMPGLAMSTATDDRLKRWQLYRPGEQHARDAARHAITFMRRMTKDANLRSVAWPDLYRPAPRARVSR